MMKSLSCWFGQFVCAKAGESPKATPRAIKAWNFMKLLQRLALSTIYSIATGNRHGCRREFPGMSGIPKNTVPHAKKRRRMVLPGAGAAHDMTHAPFAL